MSRWRVKVKVFDHGARLCDRNKAVYKSRTWFDAEPTETQMMECLEKAMLKYPETAGHFYGEATAKPVLHTSRSKFVPA